jgi:hypothetical protein
MDNVQNCDSYINIPSSQTKGLMQNSGEHVSLGHDLSTQFDAKNHLIKSKQLPVF